MKTMLNIAAALLASVATGQVLADALPIRHGLWQQTFRIRTQSGDVDLQVRKLQEQLAAMPPELRKMTEQMMAAQGVGFGQDSQSIKVCISKETAALGIGPQQSDDCTHKITERKGNTIKMTFTCNGNPPSSGESEITFNGPTSYTGKSVINTTVEGRPERMTVEGSGKWLSYDCGNLKAR